MCYLELDSFSPKHAAQRIHSSLMQLSFEVTLSRQAEVGLVTVVVPMNLEIVHETSMSEMCEHVAAWANLLAYLQSAPSFDLC